jgi:hypothetical protein
LPLRKPSHSVTKKVYAAVAANRAGALDLLKQIVNIDSDIGDVAGDAKVAAILGTQLKALGAEVRTEKSEVSTFRELARVSVLRGLERPQPQVLRCPLGHRPHVAVRQACLGAQACWGEKIP